MIATLLAAALVFHPGVAQSFESMSKVPADWKLVEYVPGTSAASIESGDAADGKHFLRLSSPKPNHARLMIPATVEPGATYRFSARVRASGAKEVTAVLAAGDSMGTTTDPIPGDGQWHVTRLFVHNDSARQLPLVLSLGWVGNLVSGQADFDLLKFKKVDAVPDGAKVVGTVAAQSSKATGPTPGPSKAVLPLTIALLVLLIGCGRVLLRSERVV